MSAVVPVLRAATVEDLDAIAEVMRVSVLDLFPAFYDERQTASAAVHIAHVDPMLVVDGTYFVSSRSAKSLRAGAGAAGADCIPETATTRVMIVFSIRPRRPRTSERCSYAKTGPGGDWAGRFWRPAETQPAPRASSVSI